MSESYISTETTNSHKFSGLSLPSFFRFLTELTTWVWLFLAGFWYLTILSLVALAAFNFPGDKKVQGIIVPGWIRISIEIFSGLLGIFGAWVLIGDLGTLFQSILVVVTFFLDRERWKWMLGWHSEAPSYVQAVHAK